MDTQGLPAPRPLLGQGGARPRCGPSLGTPIRGSSQAEFGARSCGLGATRSSPGRRRYQSRVRRVGVEAQHPWWGPGGPPRPQGLRGWWRGCGESGRGAARSAFRPGDGFLSESGRGAAPSVTVRAHGRGAFSFPFGGFGLGVFFLLCGGRGGSGGHDHGKGPLADAAPPQPPTLPRRCWRPIPPRCWPAGRRSCGCGGWRGWLFGGSLGVWWRSLHTPRPGRRGR